MSKIEVNAIEPQSGTTLTLGASGDTVTLAVGASQSGFGRSGSVNWDTTKKTANFTAVSGNGYFLDTTTTTLTITLPTTPAAGDIVSIADYDGTAGTNAITVGRNSSNINGDAADLLISKNYAAISFVYVDATAGWRSVDTSNVSDVINPFVTATGGTITTCGDYKIHTFTGPGTFTVTNAGNATGSNSVDYLVVAGAGGGGPGCGAGAGGGAGGMRASATTYTNAGPSSPRTCGVAGLPVTATAYPITVGSGGPAGSGFPGVTASNGNPSVFSTITSTGGGKGGSGNTPIGRSGNPGGSGGGASRGAPNTAGTGNTPPVSPPQGSNGGTDSTNLAGGGGGGALAAGNNSSPAPTPSSGYGGNGGVGGGFPNAFGTSGQSSGGFYYFSGGGGGGSFICATNTLQPTAYAQGGLGGGGSGSLSPAPSAPNVQFGSAGTANTGGGGGGGGEGPASGVPNGDGSGGNGGSGIVVIRYKFQ
jgi:hypothetical protein